MTAALIGKGRSADVFALDDSRVLRQYREPQDVETEARVMEHARAHGVPVPRVFEAHGNTLIMERIEGPTMLAYTASHPWEVVRQARLLARLHEVLHGVPALPGLDQPFGEGASPPRSASRQRSAESRWTVIIDWTGACAGPGAADVALTWLLLDMSEVPGRRIQRTIANAGRALFLKGFLRRAGRDEARPFLSAVARERLRYGGLVGREAAAIRRLLSKEGLK
jgi:aminoglycoside phosphotransferase (APT) family kinase protein